MRLSRRLYVSALCLCATLVAPLGHAAKVSNGPMLKHAAIQALVAGNTSVGRHVIQGYRFRRHYVDGGVLHSFVDDASAPDIGRWWVDKDKLCVAWEGFDQPLCRNVLRGNDGKYRKVLVTRKGKRKLVIKYGSIHAGIVRTP